MKTKCKHAMLDWILDQKRDISGTFGRIWIMSVN